MKLLYVLALMILLILCSCNHISNGVDLDQTSDPLDVSNQNTDNCAEGEDDMNERLITKEELFEYIQTHDVGLTIEDFNEIDVEDFIATRHLTPSTLRLLWKKTLENYLRQLGINERAKYFAKEIISVESTDEEFEKFIEDFFKAINEEILSSFYDKASGFYFYKIEKKYTTNYLYIARTNNIDELMIGNDPNDELGLLVVYIPQGDAELKGNFCYSKNNKYILLSDPVYEWMLEDIKVFCEMDD